MSSVLAPDEARRRQEAFVRLVEERRRVGSPSVQLDVTVSKILDTRARTTRRSRRSAGADSTLTAREREVAALLLEGHSNNQIAALLWIAEETVKTHLKRVIRKTSARNRTHAAVLLARQEIPALLRLVQGGDDA